MMDHPQHSSQQALVMEDQCVPSPLHLHDTIRKRIIDTHQDVSPLLQSLFQTSVKSQQQLQEEEEEREEGLLRLLDSILRENSNFTVTVRSLNSAAEILLLWAQRAQAEELDRLEEFVDEWRIPVEMYAEEKRVELINTLCIKRNGCNKTKKQLLQVRFQYELVIHELIRQSVLSVTQFIQTNPCPLGEMGVWTLVQSPARIDLAGGWTDTPPIAFEYGGEVLNCAVRIDNVNPLRAKIRRMEELEIKIYLHSYAEEEVVIRCLTVGDLMDYNKPLVPGALIKACLIATELVQLESDLDLQDQLEAQLQGGLEIHSYSNLPQGSGLGTSSILAGVLIAGIGSVIGRSYDPSSLVHLVLYVEQLLTTGGGWQDQIGGLLPGIKYSTSLNQLPFQVYPKSLIATEKFINKINEHLMLIYTGKTRLAKDLLQSVLRRWYTRSPEIVKTTEELILNARDARESILEENIQKLGDCLNVYWTQKKKMAPNCEPVYVTELMKLIENDVYGQELAGAGGGGFMVIITRAPNDQKNIENKIRSFFRSHPCPELFSEVSFHTAQVDLGGLRFSLEN